MPRPVFPRAAVWVALFVTVLWSSSWILIRRGLDDEGLRPLGFAGLRYGLAAVVLLAVLLGRPGGRAELRSLDRRTLVRIVTLGLVFYAATQGAQFVAIANQPAATSSLVLSMTPLLVATLSARSLGERPVGRQVAGAALVAAGAWAYFSGDLGATAVGMAAAVVSLVANAVAALLGRHVNRAATVSPLAVTSIGMLAGAALLLPIGLATEGRPAMSGPGWVLVGWLALVNTALAFTLWTRSQRHLTAIESAGINNTMLVQIGALAWLFLGERPGVAGWAGMALVTIGVFLTRAARPATAGPAEG
jgi:drug/metabolite transporter (DMT)-like permease